MVVGVGEVEAAAEEAVEGALGDDGLLVGDPSTVVAGAVAELRRGDSNAARGVFHRGRAPLLQRVPTGIRVHYPSWSRRRVR